MEDLLVLSAFGLVPLAIIRRYILTPEILDVLEVTESGQKGEIKITNALITLAKQGKMIAYKFEGIRFDCGSIKGFIQVTKEFARLQCIL